MNTIEVHDLVKAYKLYEKPADRIKEAFLKNRCYHKDFMAVDGITFCVEKGETVGIIGSNGAGKSTLLKMITGVLLPTAGRISLSGNVSALLELGAGFDAERNGIDNIYLNGRIQGLSKKEIDASVPQILEFADIGNFIYQPIKTYSSGMLVRLAFSVAVNIMPEILIVDEALSVGDVRFQQKCYRKIREFTKNGTVLFVSHDTGAISSFCDRVIWMDKGKIYKEGKPGEMIEEYLSYMRYDVTDMEKKKCSAEDIQVQETADNTCRLSFGNQAASFLKITLTDEKGKLLAQAKPGQKIRIAMEIAAKRDVEFPILGFNIKDILGNELVVTNTVFEKVKLQPLKAGEVSFFQWQFTFPDLHSGDYPVDLALAEGTYANHEQIHFVSDALVIQCVDDCLYPEGRGRLVPRDIKLLAGQRQAKEVAG
ncbi:MAG: ABC transporter ATP-binding protein [Eubacterium sp.]|nr:ABC transporter ATP-binding protein [Eubacterium sp.]